MGKKVIFIEPKPNRDIAFAIYLRKWPLLGAATMATMLQRRGHDVKVYSENISGSVLDDDRVFGDLLEADFIGVSALTTSVGRAYEISKRLRKAGCRARLAIGGPHVSFRPEEALEFFPRVIRGEGENIVIPLVEDEHPPAGIIEGSPVLNLDDLPTPDLTLMYKHENLWKASLWKDAYEVPVSTARGCPHNCRYCAVTPMYGRKCRFRSTAKVLEDVKFYLSQGFRSFFFYDDNFTADRHRALELLELLTPLGIRWNSQCRIDFPWIDPASRTQIDKPLMKAVKQSGADVMYIGYETIDDATAKDWGKGYRGAQPLVDKMEQDTRILHDYGVWIHGMFVIGPQHDADTFQNIVNFALRNGIDSLQMSILTPFPGTEMMEELKDSLVFKNFPDDWRFFDGAHATFHHKKMGNQALQEAMLHYHRKYYHGVLHQWDRLRRLFFGPGKLHRKLISGVRMASKVRGMLNTWEAETAEFIKLTAERGRQFLKPE